MRTWVMLCFMLIGCAPRSMISERRHPFVRSQFPPDYVPMLEQAERLELIALDETEAFPERLPEYPDASVRARVEVELAKERRTLLTAFYRSVVRGTGVGLCFHPHHAIRAVRGDQQRTFVICLSCRQSPTAITTAS